MTKTNDADRAPVDAIVPQTSVGPAPRCDWCGKFTKNYVIHQPHTESWKLEPNDPELLCDKCSKSA